MIAVERWSPVDGLTFEPNALAAATETARNLVLTAGPGAGKTEMLAQRADFLLRTGACRYPRRILAISFKTDASHNLKARVRKRCGPELAGRFDSQTFHAFAKRIIDRFRPILIGRDALEARVLEGLKDHLLHPDLIAEFATEYQREFNRLHAADRASRSVAERELALVKKRIDQIVEAICDGLYHASMKARLTDLEARKATLEAELAVPEERPVPLHPGLVQIWRRKVAQLTEALNADATRIEAAEILRGLIETIRMIPNGEGLKIELVGELAGLLSLGANANAHAIRVGVRQITVVAGAGSNLHLLPEQVKMVEGTGIDHNLQSTPVKMVAGGCNHHYLRPTNSHFPINAKSNAGRMVAKNSSFHSVLFRTAA